MIPSTQIDTPEKEADWRRYVGRYYHNRRWAIENHFKIRTKDQRLIYLRLNEAQDRLYQIVERQEAEGLPVRIIGVKPRKVGLSTGIQALFFHRATTREMQKAMTVAHDLDSTEEMFGIPDLIYNELPEQLRPMKRYASRGELVFENPDETDRQARPGLRSQLRIGTAGKIDLGRSKDIHLLHCCLDSATWVLAIDGTPRRMRDLKVGDSVRTHTGLSAAISFVSTKKKQTLAVTLFGANEPLIATPEHKVWTETGWRKLGQLTVGASIGMPVCKIGNNSVRWPMRLSTAFRPQGGGTQETGPCEVTATYELGRILGLYLAEGTINRQSSNHKPSAVRFAVHEREVARTLAWLEPFSECWHGKPHVYTPKGGTKTRVVSVHGRSWAEFVRMRCGEVHTKKLPVEWRVAGEPFARGLVHGYLAGDGYGSKHKYRRGIHVSSIHGAIVFGMRDLIAALGYGWPAIRYQAGAVRHDRNEKPKWTLSLFGGGVDRLSRKLGWECPVRHRKVKSQAHFIIRDGYAWLPIRSIKRLGHRTVMDFTINHPDHSYLVWQGAVSNSESPYWPDAEKTELALLNAVPDLPSTMVFKEGTPNGVGTKFYRDYEDAKAGRSAYAPYSMAWWEFREYAMPFSSQAAALDFEQTLDEEEGKIRKSYSLTLEQLNWRRWALKNKCGGDVNKLDQEYPANDVDCPDANTRVGTDRGIVRIADIEIGAMSDHGRVVAKVCKGERPVYSLVTKRGYTVRTTPEHLFAREDNVFEKCESMIRRTVQLQPPTLSESVHVEEWIGFGGVRHSLTIDERWGAFLGYFMGDGSFGGEQLSMVSDARDKDITARNVDLISNLFGVIPTVRAVGNNRGGREVRVQTKQFCEIFGQLGIITNPVRGTGVSKRVVCVPECIWRSPREVVRAFLSNLFEADGWASRTHPVVKFFSKHIEFTRDVQRLLLGFGVPSTIRSVIKKLEGKEFPGNELVLNAREAILFMQKIGFVSRRKRNGYAGHCPEPLFDKRCPAIAMTDTVVSVEPDGTAEVWDIQIDGSPVFSAGGILIHNCFLVSGRPRFDPRRLREMLLAAKDPVARGILQRQGSRVTLQANERGFVRIWKPPALGRRYAIGADVAEGLAHGDFSAGHVYDWLTLEMVAEWHGHIEPDLFGEELAKLGKIYNDALIGVEANKDGGTVNTRLKNLGYPHLFYRQDLDRRTNRKTAKLGWLTTVNTKPLMIDSLAATIMEGARIPSRETVSELMTFVYHDNGSLGAQEGCFDDRVVASAIAVEIRKRQSLSSLYPNLKVKK